MPGSLPLLCFGCSGDGAQEGEDVDEGAVVERDSVVVATFEGEDLGPAAVWGLGCQEIVDTAGERRAPEVGAAVGGGGGGTRSHSFVCGFS